MVHLVLDGQISHDGLPNDIPGADDLRRELAAFCQDFGFTVFGRSFSHYLSTAESLSNLLNGQAASRARVNIATSGSRLPQRGIRLRDNLWFRILSGRGYRIRVYQTDYLDFCTPNEANIDYCFVAPSNSISSIMNEDLPVATKARAILNAYLSGSTIFRISIKALAPLAKRFDPVHGVGHWPREKGGWVRSQQHRCWTGSQTTSAPRRRERRFSRMS